MIPYGGGRADRTALWIFLGVLALVGFVKLATVLL